MPATHTRKSASSSTLSSLSHAYHNVKVNREVFLHTKLPTSVQIVPPVARNTVSLIALVCQSLVSLFWFSYVINFLSFLLAVSGKKMKVVCVFVCVISAVGY